MIDYHIHTIFSDGSGTHEEYLKAAIKKGMTEIGFSDHICFKKVEWTMKISDIPIVIEKIQSMNKESAIPIKFGIELDFLPGFENETKEFIKKYPFDYVIGSVHHLDDWCFDSPKQVKGYEKWDIDELYVLYFDLVRKAASTGLFDIIAHPDVIKKFGHRPTKNIDDLLEETAKALKEGDVCIDINTSGLIKPCKEIYPGKQLLEMCYKNGVPITFGSDSHLPARVGADFDYAAKLVRDAGYTKSVKFTGRKREFVEI
ncbi:MAG: histidinol-phosphatase HisJ family protein [bacterium]|nr:histidinol-phosphatase HisJ family protein [bacterium]